MDTGGDDIVTVTVSNVLTVTDYPEEVGQWCMKNLTLPNPDYAKKLRMHLWTGNTPKTIDLYEKHGGVLILPFGTLRRLAAVAPVGTQYASAFAQAPRIDYGGADMSLDPYQQKAAESVYTSRCGILQSPAGSGKTQIGIALIKLFGKRALWLTHTKDLLGQSKARAERYIDHDLIGTIAEGKVDIGKGVTFATVQTMCMLDLARYRDYWDVIIVDECHRCAGSPTAVTQFSKVLGALSARHKIGLSATVHRSDGMIAATYALLGDIVYIVPREAVENRIMRVGVKTVSTGIGLSRACLNTDGTLCYTRLITYLCENAERNRKIAETIIANRDRPSLILSDRLDHLAALMKALPPDMREKAVTVNGKMTSKKGKAEREKAIDDMRSGRKTYLFATYALAKEGLDIPRLERLYLTTPQKDYAVVTQSIGRIARTFEGKGEPVAYDFTDNIGYLIKAYKQRCRHYKKAGAYLAEDEENADRGL